MFIFIRIFYYLDVYCLSSLPTAIDVCLTCISCFCIERESGTLNPNWLRLKMKLSGYTNHHLTTPTLTTITITYYCRS